MEMVMAHTFRLGALPLPDGGGLFGLTDVRTDFVHIQMRNANSVFA